MGKLHALVGLRDGTSVWALVHLFLSDAGERINGAKSSLSFSPPNVE
jgi:hypothetical protein